MTKHVLDRPRQASTGHMARYLKIERAQHHGDRARLLMLRLKTRASDRLRAYARINRGQTV
ncbi:MAG: hypothetical protein ACXIU7_03270 [Roseinatronobacter sp.]|jgi:hypothetical protein